MLQGQNLALSSMSYLCGTPDLDSCFLLDLLLPWYCTPLQTPRSLQESGLCVSGTHVKVEMALLVTFRLKSTKLSSRMCPLDT